MLEKLGHINQALTFLFSFVAKKMGLEKLVLHIKCLMVKSAPFSSIHLTHPFLTSVHPLIFSIGVQGVPEQVDRGNYVFPTSTFKLSTKYADSLDINCTSLIIMPCEIN